MAYQIVGLIKIASFRCIHQSTEVGGQNIFNTIRVVFFFWISTTVVEE